MNIPLRDVMTDPALFGGQFGGESWAGWRALLCGFYGEPLEDDELSAWQAITGRQEAPTNAADELWLAVGRRGGKSQCAALLAVYEACFRDHRAKLSPGEVATVMVMAADRKQARAVFRYVRGMFESNAMLERLVVREDRESLELANGAAIEVTTASFRSARGYTAAAVIADEIAFWHTDDSANPDHEILSAVRPALATLGGPLIALSSPYAKRGELWQAYRLHFAQEDDPILVAQAPSRVMNPELPQSVVDRAYQRDSEAASAEYGAEFREGISAFVDREQVERLCRPEPLELPPVPGVRYIAFTDPTGGGMSATADEFTLAIGHHHGELIVVDVLRAMRGRPDTIIEEFSRLLRGYGIREVTGDRYAGQFPSTAFEKHGIRYRFAEDRRTGLYQYALNLLNSGRLELPPDDRMVTQFAQLERRVTRSGIEQIDHGPGKGAHDDRANAVAGLAYIAGQYRPMPNIGLVHF